MYLPQNLSYLADKAGMRKAHFAKALNISPSQAGNYMSGASAPKIEGLIEIARHFDVNIDDLLLKDLTKEAGRPFGAEGEDQESVDETLKRMNELLEQRLKMVEAALKRSDPDLAKEYGIE